MLHFLNQIDTHHMTERTTPPTVWFVTRHPGARIWAGEQGIRYDRLVDHLDPQDVQPGDIVLGTLPMREAALICSRGAKFWAFTVPMRVEDKGRELHPKELKERGACLKRFVVAETAEALPACVLSSNP